MSKFRLGLAVIAGVGFVVIVGTFIYLMSQTQVDPQRSRDVDESMKLGLFESIPAEELMSDGEFKYYTRALENMDCELASILLNTAFTRYYPQFERARLKQNCLGDLGCLDWKIYAGSIFSEQGYCETVLGFNQADDEIRVHNLIPPKFNVKFSLEKVEYENYHFQKRDNNIAILIGLAEGEHIPALLTVGELLRRGDVFVHSAEAEYYVLKRACFLGYEACANLESRITELQEALAPERIALLEQKINAEPIALPFLTDLLVDGKL
ncbi:MAG: hypothetical protein JKX99_05565 [Robiginitomaculum sp.]|nr:hypothetical protein [Robiginitomaculum sp.]